MPKPSYPSYPSFRLRSHEQVQKGSRRATIRRIDGLLFDKNTNLKSLKSLMKSWNQFEPILIHNLFDVVSVMKHCQGPERKIELKMSTTSTTSFCHQYCCNENKLYIIKGIVIIHYVPLQFHFMLQYDLPSRGQSLDRQTVPALQIYVWAYQKQT